MRDHLLKEKLALHVKIQNADALISEFTYDEDNINPELSTYLYEKAEHVHPLPAKENFIIHLHTEDNSIRLPEITRRIHRHFHDEYDLAKRKLYHNSRLSLVLFLTGLLCMGLLFVAEFIIENFFLITFLDVTTWVFIWGAVEVFLIERYDIRRECAILRRLAFAEVIISYDNNTISRIYVD